VRPRKPGEDQEDPTEVHAEGCPSAQWCAQAPWTLYSGLTDGAGLAVIGGSDLGIQSTRQRGVKPDEQPKPRNSPFVVI